MENDLMKLNAIRKGYNIGIILEMVSSLYHSKTKFLMQFSNKKKRRYRRKQSTTIRKRKELKRYISTSHF